MKGLRPRLTFAKVMVAALAFAALVACAHERGRRYRQ